MIGHIKKVMGIYWWMNKCFMSYLTIRKHAPSRTAFILTSRSMGKLMPKLSESVSDSLIRPVHCLLIRPTGCPSLPVTCTRGQTKAHDLWSNYKFFFFFCKKLNMKIYTKQLCNPKIIIHQILCFSVSQTIIDTHRKTINWQNHTWTHTSKSTSPQQLTAHAGPSMDSTFVLDMS